jgi:SecD/SecF fusion protein
VGVYALSGREVTASTVAAFLTIIGYSIYDTIIIFDRVRENIPLMRGKPIGQIINQSLWETIPRSLATTFITLLPVSALFFFGGETLKDFAFAILVGISVSAFSTIFIAAPFLAVLKEREPEFRHRLEEARAAGLSGTGQPLRGGVPVAAPTTDGARISGDGARTEEPEPAAVGTAERARPADAKRERRRQRRRARPHGRAR